MEVVTGFINGGMFGVTADGVSGADTRKVVPGGVSFRIDAEEGVSSANNEDGIAAADMEDGVKDADTRPDSVEPCNI